VIVFPNIKSRKYSKCRSHGGWGP